jgi:hypothetical protein
MFLIGLLDILIPFVLLPVDSNLLVFSILIPQLIIMALIFYFIDPRGREGKYLTIGITCGGWIVIFYALAGNDFGFRFYMLFWGFGHQIIIYITERLKKRNV